MHITCILSWKNVGIWKYVEMLKGRASILYRSVQVLKNHVHNIKNNNNCGCLNTFAWSVEHHSNQPVVLQTYTVIEVVNIQVKQSERSLRQANKKSFHEDEKIARNKLSLKHNRRGVWCTRQFCGASVSSLLARETPLRVALEWPSQQTDSPGSPSW